MSVLHRPSRSVSPSPTSSQSFERSLPVARSSFTGTPRAGEPRATSRTCVVIPISRPSNELAQPEHRDRRELVRRGLQLHFTCILHTFLRGLEDLLGGFPGRENQEDEAVLRF